MNLEKAHYKDGSLDLNDHHMSIEDMDGKFDKSQSDGLSDINRILEDDRHQKRPAPVTSIDLGKSLEQIPEQFDEHSFSQDKASDRRGEIPVGELMLEKGDILSSGTSKKTITHVHVEPLTNELILEKGRSEEHSLQEISIDTDSDRSSRGAIVFRKSS
jgi:hypothetical protein